jgi:hypothetical protein
MTLTSLSIALATLQEITAKITWRNVDFGINNVIRVQSTPIIRAAS